MLEVVAEEREIEMARGLATFAVTFRDGIIRHRDILVARIASPRGSAAARMAGTRGLERVEAADFTRSMAIRAARLIPPRRRVSRWQRPGARPTRPLAR